MIYKFSSTYGNSPPASVKPLMTKVTSFLVPQRMLWLSFRDIGLPFHRTARAQLTGQLTLPAPHKG